MGKIQVLDTVTIDKIAAGEVIERPASVIKELVENAIDAGASEITVEIEEGGISYMRISDNGSGIAPEDIKNAFLRHSTSKIRQVEDLVHIHSLGFRGEALSSICAVSQVELLTKTKDADFGMRYVIHGGREVSLEEAGVKDGTTFIIRQLFYNTPARRKFLKSPMTEASHVGDFMTRLALSHPGISFRFVNNGQTKLMTSGNNRLKDVIYQVYGREITSNLLTASFKKEGLSIEGYIGKPIISRGNRNFENYFINGRYIRNNIIAKAIEDGYKDYSMQHKYPFCVLIVEVDGEEVDVNVHPAKMEIRFHHQQDIYNSLYQMIFDTLREPELIPQVEIESPVSRPDLKATQSIPKPEDVSVPPAASPVTPVMPTKVANTAMQPAQVSDKVLHTAMKTAEVPAESAKGPRPSLSASLLQEEKTSYMESRPSEPEDKLQYFMEQMRERVYAKHAQEEQNLASKLPATMDEATPEEMSHELVSEPEPKNEVETSQELSPTGEQLNLFEERLISKKALKEYKIIGQVFDTYWLVEFKDNLYIIDQHAAHERVLYERTLKSMKTREYTSQLISPPIILNLSMQEAELLRTYMDQFTRIGFEFEEFGEDSYAVRAVPDNLFSIAKKDLLMQMLDGLSLDVTRNSRPDLIDEKIASMSCKSAVKGNMRLSIEEIDTLIGELLDLDNPYHCPHGRPTIIAMSKRELEKKFKRIV